MSILKIPMVIRDWGIKIPPVIRYLEKKEFVDNFFTTGELMLSSFVRCARIEDQQRNDPHEGWQTLNIHSGDSSLVGVTMPEPKMYILCTSFVQSDQMAKKFKAESYFKIHDPFNFSIAVAKAIPNCINGFQGACFYTESKETSSDLPYGSLFTEDPKSEKEITEKTESAIRQADNLNSVFNKPTTYSDQNEYRIIWFTSENTQETIKVNCKEAIRFCTLCQNP